MTDELDGQRTLVALGCRVAAARGLVDGLLGHPPGIPPLRRRIDRSIGPDGYGHRRDQCTMEVTGI